MSQEQKDGRPILVEGMPQFPIDFRETDKFVRGMDFTATVMREGVVVGLQTYVRYAGKTEDKLNMEFWKVKEHKLLEKLGTGALEMFRRYEYIDNVPGGVQFLMRAATHRTNGVTTVDFFVDSRYKIIRARTLGIEPPLEITPDSS